MSLKQLDDMLVDELNKARKGKSFAKLMAFLTHWLALLIAIGCAGNRKGMEAIIAAITDELVAQSAREFDSMEAERKRHERYSQ